MNLETRVIQVISRNIEKKVLVSPDSRLVEDLQIDSFGKLMIISALEDEFSISIDESDFEDILTVSDIVRELEKSIEH